MKAVFAHDHKFRCINNRFFSPGGLPDDVLSRYAKWFGSVTVVGRIINEEEKKEYYSEITSSNVSIVNADCLQEESKAADCIIARIPSIIGFKAIRYAKRYKKPYLVEVVGCTFDACWNYGIKGKILSVPAFITMRHYVAGAPFTLYVTSQYLQRRYPCKGRTVGVSDVSIEPSDDSLLNGRIDKICENGEPFVIGTAGAIDVGYKGQEYVIRAIPRLMQITGKSIVYELAGGGDPERLRKIAEECGVEDRVIFKGVVKHEEIFAWYDSIDLYIQSSLLEGLSRAIIEAMSRGLPCIAARKGGNIELVEDNYLFSTKSKSKISSEITSMVQSLLKRMVPVAKRNFTIANQHYDIKALCERRDMFYTEFRQSFETIRE